MKTIYTSKEEQSYYDGIMRNIFKRFIIVQHSCAQLAAICLLLTVVFAAAEYLPLLNIDYILMFCLKGFCYFMSFALYLTFFRHSHLKYFAVMKAIKNLSTE
jgi:hypothetical protein